MPAPFGCPVCGQSLRSPGPCPNRWCGRADRGFSVAFAVGVHQGALRRAIVDYKYRGRRQWAEVFARLMAAHLAAHATWFEEFDILAAMPAWLGPGSRRTWDPVGEILGRLGALVEPGWDVVPGAVVKREETPAMSGRSRIDRLAIASGPLRRSLLVPEPPAVAGARVVVVDDVLTEGSSLREVARALRRAGAREVAGLVLARPPRRDGDKRSG